MSCQTLFQQFSHQLVQPGLAFLRQHLDLFHQIGIELDRKRHQTESLVELALFAPLERGANRLASLLRRFATAGTQVPAKILNARSAGIKDLRYGAIVDEDWQERDPDGIDRAVLHRSRPLRRRPRRRTVD